MPPGLQLGVDQLITDGYLKAPTARREERDLGDLMFVSPEQIDRQTDGTLGVVSDCAILDADFMSHDDLLRLTKHPAGDATGVDEPASLKWGTIWNCFRKTI